MNRESTCRYWPAVLALALLVPAQAGATTAQAVSTVAALTQRADEVVHGKVGTMRSTFENQRVFTYIEVQVQDGLKGPLGSRTITLKLLGGVANGLRTRVIGSPCLSKDEEVVLFLKKNGSSTFDVVNLAEGKFTVARGKNGQAELKRDLSGISYLSSQETAVPATLDELARAVKEVQ